MLKRIGGRWLLPQIIVTLLAALFLWPLVIAVQVSFRGQGWGNYIAALSLPILPRFFFNSAFVTLCTIILVYVVTMLAAYAFSKLEFPGKNWLFNAMLVGLLLPGIVLTVPLFTTFRTLGLFNNYLSLILPYSALAVPFTVLLVRNFLDNIPNELLDAARIDGCNSLQILLRIILPLSRAISVVVIIWTFLAAWNEYFLALLFMRNPEMQAITQAPQYFVGVYGQDLGKVFASLVLISLPVIITYIGLQRYFEDGLTSGSLK